MPAMWILRNGRGPAEDTVAGDAFIMKPSLVDIRCALTAAIAFASLYAESHPQHAEAVNYFIEEITNISRELGESIYGNRVTD